MTVAAVKSTIAKARNVEPMMTVDEAEKAFEHAQAKRSRSKLPIWIPPAAPEPQHDVLDFRKVNHAFAVFQALTTAEQHQFIHQVRETHPLVGEPLTEMERDAEVVF
jgi:hypothetical protein